MNDSKVKQQELEAMFDRLDQEVELLYQAIEGRGDDMDEEYAEKVVRSQLENVGETVESMSEHVGEGEKISVTTPSQLDMEQE